MRLGYQSVTREGSFPSYRATLQRLLDAAVSPGTELEVHGIKRQGGTGDQYRYLAFLETVETLENVHKAQERGLRWLSHRQSIRSRLAGGPRDR